VTGGYEQSGRAVPETLTALHALLARAAEEHPDVAQDDFDMLEIAVIEVAGNTVQHGAATGEVSYTFALEVLPDRLVAVLTDSGNCPPADTATQADMPDANQESGRGIPVAHAALDEVRHERVDGKNRWHLERRRRAAPS
jgi:serine/threonine-protein kinase RsbW